MGYAVRVCGSVLGLRWRHSMRRTVRTAILQFRDLQECNPAAICLRSWPSRTKHTLNQPTPLPQTPPTSIRHQTQLPRNRQRSPVRPRRTVERNPARRPHRQCPCRRHLRTEPASTVFRCRFQPRLCCRVRAPGTEADTHRVPILHHSNNRRPPRNLSGRPPGKMARKQPHFIYKDGGIRLFNCFGESKRWPGVYFSPGQRPVPLRMHRIIAQVRNGRLFAGETVKLLRDLLLHVRPHSPGATRPAANQRE